MLLARRKKTNCQNCHYPLLENYNYCPNCSQENSDKLVSFGTLVAEVMSNYIAYDSRLGRTVIPFLFKPGLLTNEFIAGKRVKYMHPLRLYFIVSFFYFLIFSMVISSQIQDNDTNFRFGGDINVPSADSLDREIREEINTGLLESEALSAEEKRKADSVLKSLPKNQVTISAKADTGSANRKEKDINLDRLIRTPGITPEQVLDSLDQEKSWLNLLLAKQGIKLANEKGNTIVNYLISKASLMMFLLLPFFALILKLFYIRTKRLYVEHITFTLHIHTFLFFMLSVALLTDYIWPNLELVFTLSGLLIFLYFLFSFRRVYHQGWFKTLLKMFILFISYALSFSVFMVVTIIISLLLF